LFLYQLQFPLNFKVFLTLMEEISWHLLSNQKIFETLQTDPLIGLNQAQAEERLKKHGLNQIEGKRRASPLLLFLSQFNDFLIWVLLAAAIISGFILKELIDAVAIGIILLLNAVLGFVQEYKAEKALEALKKMAAPEAKVIREGREVAIPARELVPGDIVILEDGDLIPADIRLIKTMSLATDESLLTGESVPVEKNDKPLKEKRLPTFEQSNMAFMGTSVTRGVGKGVVVKTGHQTEMGTIAEIVQEEREKTPLQKELKVVGQRIGIICLTIAGVIFLLGYLRHFSLIEMFLTSVSLAVAAIPEGLPAAITVALSLGVQRMARQKTIVRRLHAVETLGSTTFICTDKTGTLTLNKMIAQRLFYQGKLFKISQLQQVKNQPDFQRLLQASLLCNEVREREGELRGDPTELSLVRMAQEIGLKKPELEKRLPRVGLVPFDSERKMMSTLHQLNGGKILVLTKGAPEAIFERCLEVPPQAHQVNEELAKQGYRILALAYRELPVLPSKVNADEVEQGLSFLGLVALNDPPRPEVPEALKVCQRAGINVAMVTGDHRLTAEAIGREIGLIKEEDAIITGRELDELSEEELSKQVEKIKVYSRVDPLDKLKIIKALQKRNHITAMTGDGVNDAPAVKMADIGVAMGETGTDVTKEAADMVITDDNFATIVKATREGRLIFENIKKFTHFLLSCNISEVGVIFLALISKLPLPLFPIQILWINLITDGFPALALGADPPSTDLMKQPPRPRHEGILTSKSLSAISLFGLIMTVASLGAFVYSLNYLGLPLNKARTILFSTLVLTQLLHAFTFRWDVGGQLKIWANPYLNIAFFSSFLLQVAMVNSPLNYLLRATPLTLNEWLMSFSFSFLAFLLNQLIKSTLALFRQYQARTL
jgi:Ca2+-transporting ATPase